MKRHIQKFVLPLAMLAAGSVFAQETTPATEMQMTNVAEASASDTARTVPQGALSSMVHQKLKAESRLADADIQTRVDGDGAVLLKGKVESPEEKQLAEELVMSIAGVTHVQNELQVP